MAEYYSKDFDFVEWSVQAPKFYGSKVEEAETPLEDHAYGDVWDSFYTKSGASAYQKRRFIEMEFKGFLGGSSEKNLSIIDIGAGVGSCSLSLLESLAEKVGVYMHVDCSEVALRHLKEKVSKLISRGDVKEEEKNMEIGYSTWDITTSPWNGNLYNLGLCIFTMSAIHPVSHEKALRNIKSSLHAGAVICFRDYALHDMTQYRHTLLESDDTFALCQRKDGTYACFFTIAYLEGLAGRVGLLLEEGPEYCCVINKNRKTSQQLRRVFLHAVMRVP
jgi:hypothetical protein